MQTCMSRTTVSFIMAVGLAALVAACASEKDGRAREKDQAECVSIAELTAPARAEVERLTAGGKVEKIDKEVEKRREVYDVEATVNGRHMEYTVGTDGVVIGTETSIGYSDLPEAVRTAAEKYFGGTSGLEATKAVENGQTTYEVEGKKDGKKVAATFDETGRFLGEEK